MASIAEVTDMTKDAARKKKKRIQLSITNYY